MLTRDQFIQKYYPKVKTLSSGTGIFPEVMMAQAIIESQKQVNGIWHPGQTELAKDYNNFFGIKDSSQWKGETVTLPTGEVEDGKRVIKNERFRVYPTPLHSFSDYIKFLKSNPRYKKAGVFNASSIAEQAQRLKQAGYATGTNYAKLITDVASKINYPISTGLIFSFAIAAAYMIKNQ